MIGAITDFAAELRTIGVPVSMVEVMDAGEALGHVGVGDREAVRMALASTMVKNNRHMKAFDTAFDVYFGRRHGTVGGDAGDAPEQETSTGGAGEPAGGGGGSDVEELVAALVEALGSGDDPALRSLVSTAVTRLSGFQPGRPVGGRYYLHRVMHRLDGARIRQLLLDAIAIPDEDVDLMHATRDEIDEISERIGPLARKLASRLAARRRHGRRGRLDVRRTIRRSLAHGGALIDPQWRPRRISKPELVLLCDVSGSMATFARFTMQLTYALAHQFSNVRTFAFIDGLDEVTGLFGPGTDFGDAMNRMGSEASLVRRDGHSDYGSALEVFADRFDDAVTPRSTVIVTGDARNNYRTTGFETLAAISARARALHWLNPEARRYWDTGDSVMSTYASAVDQTHEVRTLRQLEQFVERVALADRSARPVHLLTT